jgi:hypothetical protein
MTTTGDHMIHRRGLDEIIKIPLILLNKLQIVIQNNKYKRNIFNSK